MDRQLVVRSMHALFVDGVTTNPNAYIECCMCLEVTYMYIEISGSSDICIVQAPCKINALIERELTLRCMGKAGFLSMKSFVISKVSNLHSNINFTMCLLPICDEQAPAKHCTPV